MDVSTVIVPLILALIAAASAPGIWSLYAQRKRTASETKKLEAETAKVIEEAYKGLTMSYQKRIEELEKTVKELTERIDVLETELKDANIEIRRLENLNRGINRHRTGLES
jgi:flagellar motility protein MotE (MotC chaperone)